MANKYKEFIISGLMLLICLFSACDLNSQVAGSAQKSNATMQKTSQQALSGGAGQKKFEGIFDLAVIHKDGYTADGIIPAGGKIILISAIKSPSGAKQSETQSENTKMRLYAANVETGNIWDKYIEAGYVELSNRANHLCDDGTTAIVEAVGAKKNIVFVNPRDMTASRISVPGDDLMDIAVSPDKKKISFTKSDGTYLSDIDFSKIELVLPRKIGDKKGGTTGELSKAVTFTPDSSQIYYCCVGYDKNLGYGLFNVITRSNRFFSFPDMKASMFSSGKLFLSKVNDNAPAGYVDVSETSNKIYKISGLPSESEACIDVNSGSELIGFIRQKKDKSEAKIYNSAGKLIGESLTNIAGTNMIRVIESENVAVLTTQEQATKQAEIYVWRFR